MTSKTYPSGKVIGYVYDDKGELVSLNIDGVPKVNYNKVSNITNIQSDAMSRAFGYDNLDRLTSYEQNATDFQNFAYDANGNRLSQSQEENSSKTFDYLANSNILNTIQETKGTATKEISYEYDATGNIVKDDKHTYSYDGRNRLTAIDNNVTYQYNYDNKRVSKTVNGVKTYFIYDEHMLIGEYQLNLSDQSRQEMVYLNSTPIATVTPTGTYRIYSDHLDTSRRVAENNEQAKVLWKWESKPFGESLANDDVDGDNKKFTLNLRFPGQYFDSETKTHYNINRDYNPVTGRYIQSDPIGFDGGLNSYAYVGGMPIRSVDPRGLRKLTYGEKNLARSIFGSTINYETVDIYQEDWAGPLYVPYAMTPWNAMYFATDNKEYRKDFSQDNHPYKVSKSLFIHEMTHIWQSQHGYPLSNIIGAITGLGDYEYEISYDRYNLYSSFEDFKLEGQATIIGDFYLKLNGINDKRLTDYPTGLGKNYPLNLYRDLVGRGLGFL